MAEKMDNDFWREGPEKEGELAGLQGEEGITGGVLGFVRGGKSTRDIKDGNVCDGEGAVRIGGEGAREGVWLVRSGNSTRVSNGGKYCEDLGFDMTVGIGSGEGS